ncbi:tyrosine recombinase XerC [Deinococcus yunweiensis]|uniref:site-specific integrase n=1 Tax=Deinococcus yunweiensis TaxID=367282 RepID=UPI00398EC42A
MPRARRAKPARKGSGEKYITARRDGRFSVTVPNALLDADSGRRRAYQTTCATLAGALAARDAVLNDLHRGIVVIRDRTTVREMLVQWGGRRRAAGVEYSTALGHAWLTEVVASEIGDHPVMALEPRHVELLVARLRDRELAPSTVARAYRHLRAALQEAVLRGSLTHNPTHRVPAPRVGSPAVRETWTPGELARLRAAIRTSRLRTLFIVLMVTGTRVGEIVGARDIDYDPDSGILHIAGTAKKGGGRGRPKSRAGDRELPLPPEICRLVGGHLAEVARARAAAGPLWGEKKVIGEATRHRQRERATRRYVAGWVPAPPARDTYTPLFPSGHGTPLLVRNVQREWKRLLAQAGLPHRPLHETRAAWTTVVLEDLPAHEVQQAVGHASPAMTLAYARRVSGRRTRATTIAAARLGLTDELTADSLNLPGTGPTDVGASPRR